MFVPCGVQRHTIHSSLVHRHFPAIHGYLHVATLKNWEGHGMRYSGKSATSCKELACQSYGHWHSQGMAEYGSRHTNLSNLCIIIVI